MSIPMTLTRGLASIPLVKALWDKRAADAPKVAAPMPASLRRRCVVEVATVGGFEVTTLTPRRGASGDRFVYLHGGSYEHPMVGPHWSIIGGILRRTGAALVVVDYGLAPEHTVDEAYPLLEAVYARELERAGLDAAQPARRAAAGTSTGTGRKAPATSADYAGRAAPRVFVGGDSAGGGLAAGFALHARDSGLRMPDATFLFSPWLDVTLADPGIDALEALDPMLDRAPLVQQGIAWAGARATTDPLVSPLFGDLDALPPTHIYQGDHDILLTDAKRFAAKATRAGSPVTLRLYPGSIHVFVGAGWTPEAHRALDDVAARMR